MRTKLLMAVATGLAIMLSCVSTTSVEAPVEVDPITTFQATVHTEIVESNPAADSSYFGILSVLVPEEWSVDSVLLNGYGYNCLMLPGDLGWQPEATYPPEAGYEWIGFHSTQKLVGELGDTGQATVFITTGATTGPYTTAYLAAFLAVQPTVGYLYEGDPCSCMVEVTPLSFEQETWGHIKSEF